MQSRAGAAHATEAGADKITANAALRAPIRTIVTPPSLRSADSSSPSRLCTCRRAGLALRLDLIDRGGDRVERQQRRCMPGLVVAHRLEHCNVGPFSPGRRAI